MDTLSIQSFPTHVLFKQSIVIIHYISMVIAFLGCHPLLLTQQLRRQKIYIQSIFILFALIGFISGFFIITLRQLQKGIFMIVFVSLFFLVFTQILVSIYRFKRRIIYFKKNIPKWVDLALAWLILLAAVSYLSYTALLFTESCPSDSHDDSSYHPASCIMPVTMGTGFLVYGTLILLHLLSIIHIPRPSTPEYYEGIIITFWGFISLFLADTPIIGSEWRAIFRSIMRKNIINAFIICLTGRAIVRGLTQTDDPYCRSTHYVRLFIHYRSHSSLIQIIFRKSPADNLPHRMFQPHTDTTNLIDDDDDDNDNTLLSTPSHYQRNVDTRLLASLLSICGGILLMGSNVGWIRYMRFYIKDPSTYVNLILAAAFLWSTYVFLLCTIYKKFKSKKCNSSYEYIELNNSEERQQHSNINNNNNDVERKSSSVDSIPSLSSTTTTNNNHHPITLSPTLLPSSSNTLPSTTKTIRPSEYRAKRRSLLLTQNSTVNHNNNSNSNSSNINNKRVRRLSNNYGVGVYCLMIVRSWRSSMTTTTGSFSVGFYSEENEEEEEEGKKYFYVSSSGYLQEKQR
ncbi:uncharacterized protein BX663DRAFT_518879 [Cokeromyces recurvatus]|uniref:uncharacterized protein n=1 Tax=Cokeromyces recurvatus TaxID=90255 RepID=UPI00221E4BE1|nr:uncharacterized protein BX663DRAFT_518879 [Cokeromyces recurvatus]KAI7900182.1 hypothetical protein BX663DRAFT_518879 [Cokeromyces recurvatus]